MVLRMVRGAGKNKLHPLCSAVLVEPKKSTVVFGTTKLCVGHFKTTNDAPLSSYHIFNSEKSSLFVNWMYLFMQLKTKLKTAKGEY